MSTRTYYWILAKDPEKGDRSLIKGGWSEQEARDKALEMLSGLEFEVIPLRTTNQSTASAMIRGKRLEETHDLRKARKRLGHEATIRRIIKRRRIHSGD